MEPSFLFISSCDILIGMKRSATFIFALAFVMASSTALFAFPESKEADKADCMKCHTISIENATSVIQKAIPTATVEEVNPGRITGTWELVIKGKNQKGRDFKDIIYLDFTKKNMFYGSIFDIATMMNYTEERKNSFKPKIEFAKIPVDRAIVMGDKTAKYKVIVFSDID